MPEYVTAFAPGRVNLIGEHTDYNLGLALPFAIAEGVVVRAEANDPRSHGAQRIYAYARDLDEEDEFELADISAVQGWRAFVRGAAAARIPAGHGHLHVEFYPPLRTAEKLKYLAGSEQGAGTFISDTLPEESAHQLREAIQRGA